MGSFTKNGFYNNPALGQAFNNLAGAFGPPSAGDMAAYATAQATREKSARLADLYSRAGTDFDKANVAAGNYTPSQSYYAVDTADETARRGQDMTSATARYGYDQGLVGTKYTADTTAATSRANNAADNERALKVGQIDAQAAALGTLADPDGRQSLPQWTLEDMFPNATALDAAPSIAPRSETEVLGGIIENMSPEDQLSLALGSDAPVKVMGPDGPVFMAPGEAARTNALAYIDKGSTAGAELFSYETPDGRQGSAIFDPASQTLVDANTKEVLPAGTRTAKIEGGSARDALGGTTSNVTGGNETIATARYGLGRVDAFEKLLTENPGILGVTGMVRGFAQDMVAAADEAFAAYGGADAPVSIDQVRELSARVGANGNYDPAIAQAQAFAVEMAYLQAKMQDPSGEVNVRELERQLGLYNGGIAGNQKVLANLAVLRQQLNERLTYGEDVRQGAPTAATPAAPAAGAAPAPVPVRTPEEARQLPSGTRILLPDGTEGVVP